MFVHKFSWKNNILCGVYKKDKKKIMYVVVLHHQNLSFLHEPQKNVFSFENLCTNIKCLDVHVKI